MHEGLEMPDLVSMRGKGTFADESLTLQRGLIPSHSVVLFPLFGGESFGMRGASCTMVIKRKKTSFGGKEN